MSLTITLTGTGGAQLVPVFGCDCAACRRARLQENYRRRPCSAAVKFNDAVTLLDAGIPHLMDDWPAGSFRQFCLPIIIWITFRGCFLCAGAWERPFRFTARRTTQAVTTCSSIRAFSISATRWSRL